MDPHRAIPDWLKQTRLRHVREGDGEPWSQQNLVDRIYAETGWRVYRETYSGWETGAVRPGRKTLEKLVAFWAKLGEPGPDLTVREPEPIIDPVAAAMDRQTAALDRQSKAIEDLCRLLAQQDQTRLAATGSILDAIAALPGGRAQPETATGTEGAVDGPRR